MDGRIPLVRNQIPVSGSVRFSAIIAAAWFGGGGCLDFVNEKAKRVYAEGYDVDRVLEVKTWV